MAERKESKLDELIKTVDSFIEQYELDMRGDKNLGNGNRGVIGEIRKIKDYVEKYPSLLFLFATRPFKTTGAVIGIFVLLMSLYTAGLIKIITAMLGVALP